MEIEFDVDDPSTEALRDDSPYSLKGVRRLRRATVVPLPASILLERSPTATSATA